jgi:RNA polymerase-binding transcription factor DksA
MASASHLSPAERSALRDLLAAAHDGAADRAAALARTFDDIVAAAEDANVDDEHDPEGATIAWERQQTGALADRARADGDEAAAALARFDAGDYGSCDDCGAPIPYERLSALPTTRRCVTCAAGAGAGAGRGAGVGPRSGRA